MNITRISRRSVLTASAIAIAAASILPTSAMAAEAPAAPAATASANSFAKTTLTPSQVLSSTPWKTTSALDADGNRVALTDANVANFVGWAYFKADGTFTMYNLDNSPKMHGDWSVPADGSARTIVAKDAAGNVLFTRVTPITQLDKNTFTYRVVPNAAQPDVYFDIVHTKTNHVEPGTDAKGPGVNNGQGNANGHGNGHFNNGNAR
ncbi:MAG: DUF4822 domain-containing protein [Microbacterium sp.]|jgi:hypothetical protein|nr:DUF4822 domain-containing protein [Microbacterium sp.]